MNEWHEEPIKLSPSKKGRGRIIPGFLIFPSLDLNGEGKLGGFFVCLLLLAHCLGLLLHLCFHCEPIAAKPTMTNNFESMISFLRRNFLNSSTIFFAIADRRGPS